MEDRATNPAAIEVLVAQAQRHRDLHDDPTGGDQANHVGHGSIVIDSAGHADPGRMSWEGPFIYLASRPGEEGGVAVVFRVIQPLDGVREVRELGIGNNKEVAATSDLKAATEMTLRPVTAACVSRSSMSV